MNLTTQRLHKLLVSHTSQSSVKPKPNIRRLMQVRRVCQQYDLASLVADLDLPRGQWFISNVLLGRGPKSDLPRGVRIRKALEDLGPVFIKLGQALSTRPDLLPHDIAAELAKLQDQVPAFAPDQAMQIIKDTYGDGVDDIFESVDPNPLASASVAQVHAAVLKPGLALQGQSTEPGKDGDTHPNVIIKILRPGVKEVVKRDLEVMHFLAAKVQKHWSRGEQFKPQAVVQEYENTILGELDLRVEAANGARMGTNFEELNIIYVPRIYWDLTTRNVLVMERIYGTPMGNIGQLKAQGIDLKKLAADGVNVFFKQAFEDNFFHADMHPGNIFVSDSGRWIAIDFGIMGTLTNADKHYLAEILLGFFNRDYERITRAHLRSGWIPQHTKAEEFELAVRLVCEPIFAKPLSQISFGKVLMELFQTVQKFEMPVQPQLVLLYKTLLNIEGLGRQLYPDLNLWDTAKPYLENWMKEQLSPKVFVQEVIEQWPQLRAEMQAALLKYRRTHTEEPPLTEPKQSTSNARYAMAGLFGLGLWGGHAAGYIAHLAAEPIAAVLIFISIIGLATR